MAGKADMVDHLANSLEGLTKKQAGEAVDEIIKYIADTLTSGDRVQLPGLGILSVAERKARQGLNPQTRKTINIPASKAVKFKPAKSLKDAVNG